VRVEVEQLAPRQFVVTLVGELDLATGPVLADTVTDLVGRGQVDAVVVDVSELRFLDSSGLRTLLQARAAVTERDADFRVRGARDPVAQVIRIAALDQVLGVAEQEAASPPKPPA
jgi:anti-sigma B factor antagonist